MLEDKRSRMRDECIDNVDTPGSRRPSSSSWICLRIWCSCGKEVSWSPLELAVALDQGSIPWSLVPSMIWSKTGVQIQLCSFAILRRFLRWIQRYRFLSSSFDERWASRLPFRSQRPPLRVGTAWLVPIKTMPAFLSDWCRVWNHIPMSHLQKDSSLFELVQWRTPIPRSRQSLWQRFHGSPYSWVASLVMTPVYLRKRVSWLRFIVVHLGATR